MKAYHITQWDELYETHETRKIRVLTFYAKPNKLIGEGIGATLAQPDNMALLGTWAVIEALASTSPRDLRGWLIRNGTPLTAARMGALTRVDAAHFDRALDWFSRPEIGWLELKENALCSGDSPGNPAQEEMSPGDSPGNPAQEEMSPGDSPGNPAQEERGKEKERGRKTGERGTPASASRRGFAPSIEEVEAWAIGAGVDPEFAREKLAEGQERGDFEKDSVCSNWRSRFTRFWKSDEAAWRRKKQKNAAGTVGASASRPDGWMEGDAPNWWTDSLADLRGALAGAARLADKKTAARLREILTMREKGNQCL